LSTIANYTLLHRAFFEWKIQKKYVEKNPFIAFFDGVDIAQKTVEYVVECECFL
jgi:hypothetical protein